MQHLHSRFIPDSQSGPITKLFFQHVLAGLYKEAVDVATMLFPLGYSQAVWLVNAVRTPVGNGGWDHFDDSGVRQAYCELLSEEQATISVSDVLSKRREVDHELVLQMAMCVQSNYVAAISKMIIQDHCHPKTQTGHAANDDCGPGEVTLENELLTLGIQAMIVKLFSNDGPCAAIYPAIIRRIVETIERRNANLYRKALYMAYDHRPRKYANSLGVTSGLPQT